MGNPVSEFPTWRQPDGTAVACVEKINMLNRNLIELKQMAQDALDDAILMGCDERQIRHVLSDMIASLKNSYPKAD